MDLDRLRTFRAVARAGSFTAASELLGYAQSTVSVHIRALEAEVGAPLFDRLPAGVHLTEAGQRLMPLAEQMLTLAAAATAVACHDKGKAVGEVTIAAPETIIAHRLPAVLRHLRDRHPQVEIRLESVPYHQIRPAVAAGLIDVGFLFQPPLRPTSSLAIKQLRTEALLMVAAPDHPLARPVDDVAEQFARTSLFLTERGCGYRSLLESYLDLEGVRAGNTLEFDSVEAIRRCVEAGLGVALIPEAWLTDPLRTGTLVPMDWFAPRFEVATQLAWHPSRWQGPALTAIIEASETCIDGHHRGPLRSPSARSARQPPSIPSERDVDQKG